MSSWSRRGLVVASSWPRRRQLVNSLPSGKALGDVFCVFLLLRPKTLIFLPGMSDFCVIGVLLSGTLPTGQSLRNELPSNQFTPRESKAGSPMSSVISVTAPELGASLTSPTRSGWICSRGPFHLPHNLLMLGDQFDYCESTLLKAESDLGFDASWRPCALQMSCGPLHLLKRALDTLL